ncbi:MAG: serine hydrolase domain-containing protein [Planctomycetota bacterium]
MLPFRMLPTAPALLAGAPLAAQVAIAPVVTVTDTDRDGIDDPGDSCPVLSYTPAFQWTACAPMDLDPDNDPQPACKARERVARLMLQNGRFTTHMAFAVVKSGVLHFADAFEYVGGGQWVHDPAGIYHLYRIGSTSKSVTAVAAKILEENRMLSLGDYVSADDASRLSVNGQVTLRQLLSHQGAFKVDSGAIHLFCYRGDLRAFWREPDDLVSPHYDSPPYGNLGGGYQYSAFNYSLAGAYLTTQTGRPFAQLVQTLVFDRAGMCTATFDSTRATRSPIGAGFGVSQAAVMHVGPYINLVTPTDPRCVDNFYSSPDVYGQSSYTWQAYHLDEAGAEPRDPPGGVIASAVDLAHFAEALLASYHAPGGIVSQAGIRELWQAHVDLGCGTGCPYESYYGLGFFTDSLPGRPVNQVGHGGSRPGYASAFVLRPERNSAVVILANADVSTVSMSNVAKEILDDFR